MCRSILFFVRCWEGRHPPAVLADAAIGSAVCRARPRGEEKILSSLTERKR